MTATTSASPLPQLTVVVPTFNEAGNVPELASRLVAAIGPTTPYEVLFVDDSTDGTAQVVAAQARRLGAPLVAVRRPEPVGGLSGAVVEGLRRARAEWVVVLDGDLQHPPELIPELVAAGARTDADVVVASRYAPGGSEDGLANGYRRAVSRSATALARLLFPSRLAGVSDPMSGYFAVRRSRLRLDELRPVGFKILLEVILRGDLRRITEVPFGFRERLAGESTSALRHGVQFLRQLADLRVGGSGWGRMLAFGAIGLSGFLPNLLVLWLLTSTAGMHYAIASALSTQVAIVWNFVLLDLCVFAGRYRFRWPRRLGSFLLLGNGDLVLRIPLLALLVERFSFGVLTGTVITLGVAFGLRFLTTDRLLYLARRPQPSTVEARPLPVEAA
jgi:dolichol-phosphate mannosyltransferase